MTGAEVRELISAIRSIAHGGQTGATGLEMLSMAIIGEGLPGHDQLTAAIRDGSSEIAEAISDGLHEIAQAIGGSK